jgi:hypothetical protein
MSSSAKSSLVEVVSKSILMLLSALLLVVGNDTYAEPQQELILFLSAEASDVFDVDGAETDNTNFLASADVLYSYSSDRFRLLGEYLLSNTENELERLQLGWRPWAPATCSGRRSKAAPSRSSSGA